VGSHGQQLRQYFQNDDLEGGAEFVKDLSNRLSGPGLISAQESVSTERLNLNLDERVRAQYEIGAEQTSFSPLGFALMLSRMKPGRGPDKLASALIEAGMCSTEQNDLGLALSLNRVTYAERLLASPCKVHDLEDRPDAWTRPLREYGGMVVDLSKELLRRDSGETGGAANWVFESCDPRESPEQLYCSLPAMAQWRERSPTLRDLLGAADRKALGRIVDVGLLRRAVSEWYLPYMAAVAVHHAAQGFALDVILPMGWLPAQVGGGTMLHHLAFFGDTNASRMLLAHDPGLEARRTPRQRTAADIARGAGVAGYLGDEGEPDGAAKGCPVLMPDFLPRGEGTNGGWNTEPTVDLSAEFWQAERCRKKYCKLVDVAPERCTGKVAEATATMVGQPPKGDALDIEQPFIFRNGASGAAGWTWQTSFSYEIFIARYGREPFDVSGYPYQSQYEADAEERQVSAEELHARAPTNASRREWRDAAAAPIFGRRPPQPLPYIFDKTDDRKKWPLLRELPAYPSLLFDNADWGGLTMRPLMTQLGIGPAYTGAPPHTHSAAWNGLAHGTKLWFLFPPHKARQSFGPGLDQQAY
jgi:hypothetical protein